MNITKRHSIYFYILIKQFRMNPFIFTYFGSLYEYTGDKQDIEEEKKDTGTHGIKVEENKTRFDTKSKRKRKKEL